MVMDRKMAYANSLTHLPFYPPGDAITSKNEPLHKILIFKNPNISMTKFLKHLIHTKETSSSNNFTYP